MRNARARVRLATRLLYRQHRCRYVAPADYVVSESCFNAKCVCPNASTTSVPILKPSHHRPRGLVRGRHPLFRSSPLCPLLPSRNACIGSICSRFSLATLGPKRGRCIAHRGREPPRPAAEMRVTDIKSAPPVTIPIPFPSLFLLPFADSFSSPSRHDRAGLRAFLMLNVAFCLCGYMGDSGESWSPGQRFFQMLNARFVPTHPVCVRATWHLQGCPEQVSEQDSCVDW